ncbi:glycosyltransferase family 4 protein [Blastococcus sp. CT_GayMR16]|uniref:glycosyltransferase family 4 protein n=1 Tax=Blastococcus sp. CT_GayMR16 TaxID=2559607 RepID=UPI0010733FC3|nr:glycosyltransferase family 4 protein [Blastococcus sp. CT_GayMR16]TFV90714.1 glycosyltransferase [Blastococcus sp. CT_GayMR16]
MTTHVPGPTIIAVHPHADLYGSDRMFLESIATMAPDVLVVLSKQGPLVDAVAGRGITHEIMDFPVLRKVELRTPWKALVFLVRFLRSVATLTAWLRSRRPAVLYVSTIAAPEWLIAGRLSRTRVVCHLHESVPEMSRTSSALLLSPLLAAHLVLANSEGTLAWIRSSLGERVARRSRVLHNGVREPSRSATVPQGPKSGSRRLVVVGRLSAIKGQDIAIRATALVRKAGFDATLTLVGDGYPGYEDLVDGLHALAASEGVSDVTDFTGFQDPTPYVADADVVLMPSRVESFGLVAVEALLLGRPVVATRIGGLPEVIKDGETGLLVDPDDPQALADAVIRLLSHPEEAAALGRAGLADARARFSIEAYSAALTDAVLQST